MAVGPDSAKLLLDLVVSDLSFYRDVLAAIGLIYVGKSVLSFTWSLYKGMRTHFFSKLHQNDIKKYGNWAVVTGCTDGIGRAYCFEFAKRGMNIAMIARNSQKLQNLSDIIEEKYKVEVLFLTVDFNSDAEIYEHIAEFLGSFEPGILVNNVGVISPRPSFVQEMSDYSMWEHVKVNIMSATIMSRLVLPRMVKRKQGAIINIASIAALSPAPLLAVYAATKAYVQSFSRALHQEVKGSGVVVQTLIPSYVGTRMVSYSEQLSSSIMTPSPEVFAKNALNTLGRSDHTTGYWLHGIQVWIMSCFPESFRIKGAYHLNKYFRNKYLHQHHD